MKKLLKLCFNTSVWKPTRQEWLQILTAIPKEERERIDKYMFKRDAKQTLIGHLLIRFCLKTLLNVEWNHIILSRTSNGRPYVKLKETFQSQLAATSNQKPSKENMSQLLDCLVDFNVSHSGDYAIIGAGIISPAPSSHSTSSSKQDLFRIGVDVMKVDVDRTKYQNQPPAPGAPPAASTSGGAIDETTIYQRELASHARVMNTKFSEIEKNYIRNRYNDVERLTAFYRLWCLKESYVKAVGEGIGFDLKRVELLISSDLYLDLNGRKHIVAGDTSVFVDSKPVKHSKFYEQYYTDMFKNNNNSNSNSSSSSEQPASAPKTTNLHIMTMCIIEKPEKEKTPSQASVAASSVAAASISPLSTAADLSVNESDEFTELTLKDLLDALVSIDKLDNSNCEEFEELWLNFKNKNESPFSVQ